MTELEYRARPEMNVSKLVHGITSMKHLKDEIDCPSESSPTMKRGTMVHTFIFEPREFDYRYVRMPAFEFSPDNQTSKGKPSTSKATTFYQGAVAEFEEKNRGCEVITETDIQWCEGVKRGVMSESDAVEILESSKWELPLFGNIEGVECKGRMDCLPGNKVGTLGDLKTTPSVIERVFGSSAAKLHYNHKIAWYRELARQNGYRITDTAFIAVESSRPFDCVVFDVPEIVMENALDKLREVLRNYKRSMATGIWPGRSGGKRQQIYVPNWNMDETETSEPVDWSESI